MTLTELRYIVAVAKIKHFGRAADLCCVSQPTLSLGIRKLEDSLGVTIFERGRSEVKITPIGHAIIEQAQKILDETETIKQIVDADKDQLKDPIKIASSYTIGKYLFPKLLQQMYSTVNELPVSLTQDYNNNLIQKLLDKQLDLLLLSNSKQNNIDIKNNQLNSEPLLQEDLFLLVADCNKYSQAQSLSLKQIKIDELFLLNKQHYFTEQILDLNASWLENRFSFKETNVDSLESLQDIVTMKAGATVVPAMYKAEYINNKASRAKFIPFDAPIPTRTISLVWRNDFSRTQVIDLVKRSLHNLNISGVRNYSAD